MKTEKEIANRLKVLQNTGSNSKRSEEMVFAKIELLQWVLKCKDCGKYPCTCDEPF